MITSRVPVNSDSLHFNVLMAGCCVLGYITAQHTHTPQPVLLLCRHTQMCCQEMGHNCFQFRLMKTLQICFTSHISGCRRCKFVFVLNVNFFLKKSAVAHSGSSDDSLGCDRGMRFKVKKQTPTLMSYRATRHFFLSLSLSPYTCLAGEDSIYLFDKTASTSTTSL